MTRRVEVTAEDLARVRVQVDAAEEERRATGARFPVIDLTPLGAVGHAAWEAYREAEEGLRPEARAAVARQAARFRRASKAARRLADMLRARGKESAAAHQDKRARALDREAEAREHRIGFTHHAAPEEE